MVKMKKMERRINRRKIIRALILEKNSIEMEKIMDTRFTMLMK